MSKRKAIPKRIRFEVFKRDSFTCQYCGAQAPDAVLHIDHINPIAGGGDNDVMNLLTSCAACNLGKGARSLNDQSSVAKQRKQLQELNARREQLEMMLKWRESLASIMDDEVDAIGEVFTAATDCTLNEKGHDMARGWLKKHDLPVVIEALESAIGTYYRDGDQDPQENNRLAGVAFSMVPRILGAKKRYANKPYMKDLFYARAIIRNRMHCNDRVAIDLLERAHVAGANVDDLKDWAKRARNWTIWRNEMLSWIGDLESTENGQ